MTALPREMSGSPCQRFLTSSNICEVLSSSPQLRKGSLSGICVADPQHGLRWPSQVHSSTSTLLAHSHQRKIVLVPGLWSLKRTLTMLWSLVHCIMELMR
ncbi:hypothetical protein XENOCAPTIV_011857 [Xenoophorus captivus]|uniref:Uncharacterized protein n=1 Tax=Xenoophorus captivus TaxID=1517983 RepID=A0ABV0R3K0_9TELE